MRQNYNYQIRHESYNICCINDFYREEYKRVFIKINSTWRLQRLSLFSFMWGKQIWGKLFFRLMESASMDIHSQIYNFPNIIHNKISRYRKIVMVKMNGRRIMAWREWGTMTLLVVYNHYVNNLSNKKILVYSIQIIDKHCLVAKL